MILPDVPNLQELYFHPWKLPLQTLTLVGSTLSKLLLAQEINSIPILMITTDVFEYLFLKIKSDETDSLRASRTKIKCLLEIFKIAIDRISKEGQRITPKQQTNYISFSIPSATSAISTANTCSILTVDDQRNHLLKCIDDWLSLNENLLNLNEFKLEEGTNFRLIVKSSTNGIQASIECLCKSTITLGKVYGKLTPSNFYRHLKSPGCKYINRLLKEQKLEETNRNKFYLASSSSSQLIDNNSQSTTAVVSTRKRTIKSTYEINSQKKQKD